MSGLEHHQEEIARIDREIYFHASICGIDPSNRLAIEQAEIEHRPPADHDPAWENLRGLLMLRLRVETEMTELGLAVPPLGKTPEAT